MPVNPTYPGVYVEEIPSGVRTITGVATSITAFVGRALRGPISWPVTINSFADFERVFGGLWVESSLGFAVQDFYLNGGSQAIVVRLVGATGSAVAQINANGLQLTAVSAGTWANSLRARIDKNVLQSAADRLGVDLDDLFNLTVRDGSTGVIETFANVTYVDSSRRVDMVLDSGSQLVRALPTLPTAVVAHAAPAAGQNVWTLPALSSPVSSTALGADGGDLSHLEVLGSEAGKTGMFALENADLFNILCIPPYKSDGNIDYAGTSDLIAQAAAYCERRRAMFIIDPPTTWISKDLAKSNLAADIGTTSKNTALYFPRLRRANPLRSNQLENFAPCGAVAGIFARTDSTRGVWKAPAGMEATLNGTIQLSVPLTDPENGELNPLGINALRVRPAVGPVVWGARTRQGDDRLASEWKYIPVRRLALYIEESLYRGSQWAVFEPNDEPLWAQLRLNIGAFMHNLFRQGAFQGRTPNEAYLVKVDKETTTQNDIDRGIVNILVGFAPLKPAEFVILQIQQLAGQLET
jgi:phage tail sheath protein FI